jgi:septal ring factor EnvC (AmiA/AmiB activator)
MVAGAARVTWRPYEILADATSDSAALVALLMAASGLLGAAGKWCMDRWKARTEAARTSRADTIKEWSELADRLQRSYDEVKADMKAMIDENRDCVRKHERTAVELETAKRRIAELTEELVTLRVNTAHRTERIEHAVKTVASRVIDNTVDIAVLGARSGEFPAVEVPPEDAPSP